MRRTSNSKEVSKEVSKDDSAFNAFQLCNEAIVCIDNTTNISFFNDAAVSLFGYSVEDAKGKSIKAIFPEYTASTLSYAGIKLSAPNHPTVFVSMSENSAAVNESWAQTLVFRSVETETVDQTLEQAIDAVISIDARNNVTLFNRAAEALWGYDRAEVIGRNVKILVPFELQASHDSLIETNRTTRIDKIVGTNREVETHTKQGNKICVSLALSRIFVKDEIHYTAFVRDISKEREQREFIDQTLEQAIDAVVTIDEHNDVTLFNHAAEQLWGYDRAEVIGNNVKMLVPFELQASHDSLIETNRTTRVDKIVGTNREVQVHNKHGEQLWVSLALSRIFVGEKIHYTAFVRDVSLEVQRRSEFETLSLVANRTTNSVVITDKDGYIEYVNPGFTQLTGYSLAECLNKKPGELLQGPETDKETKTRISESLASHQPFYDEILNYDRHGNSYWISLAINPVFDVSGKIERLISIQADITSTKMDALDYNYRLEAINKVAAVMELNLNGTIRNVNSNFQVFLQTTSNIEGRLLDEFLPSDFVESGKYSSLWSTVVGGKYVSDEFRFIDSHGKVVWLDASFAPILDTSNTVTKVVIYGRDASERKIYAQVLSDAIVKAEASATAKSAFLASMSHEIRTPLNGVMGALGLLIKGPLEEKQEHYAELARTSAESLLIILNDILDFSKIEAGKLALDLIPVDLHPYLSDCIEVLTLRAQEKGLELVIDVTELAHCTITTDPFRLRQVLNNLIGNSIKFTNQGQITVTAKISKLDPHLKITIQDTGIGIQAEKISGLFETFTQVDASMSRKFGGTGLGLAISKELISLLGGDDIHVKSTPNQGSAFSFSIPATNMQLHSEDALPSDPQKAPNKTDDLPHQQLHVLLVEDNAINQEIASDLLEDLGHTMKLAKHGGEAMVILQEKTECFDVILMDCQMPVMDGFATTMAIRRGEAGDDIANIPIVALTANAMKGDRERCIDAGMSDYLTKPIDFDQLGDTLLRWSSEYEKDRSGRA